MDSPSTNTQDQLRSRWSLLARTPLPLALVVMVAIGAAALAAGQSDADWPDPTHPVSETVLSDADLVNWVWSGAVTTDSAAFRAQLRVNPASTRLVVSPASEFSDARYVDGALALAGDAPVFAYSVTGLQAGTDYFYALEVDGELDKARRGRFTTPPEGPASFSFVFGSCATTGSNGSVFDAMRSTDPLFLLLGGDFHYGDVEENDPSVFLDNMSAALTSPAQSTLYRSAPVAYVWDDHDYGPNNSDRTSPSREASLTAYAVAVPHFELERDAAIGAIYQAFTVGRARYILTDLRSQRDPASMPDGPEKSMLGAEQKAWFKQQLIDAQEQYPVIFWVSTVPWISAPAEGADDWGGYAYERAEIANYIADNDIQELIMLAGDAHMVALDDGANSNYSEKPGKGFPVFHAAALNRDGSVKGGPYSDGTYPGDGQFGEISVTDDGTDQITVTMTGKTFEGEILVTHTVILDAPYAIDPWPAVFGQIASGYFTPD